MDQTNSRAVAAYKKFFDRALSPGEILLNASPSIHVEVSERLGKGAGDGTIGVTNMRVIQVYSLSVLSTDAMAMLRSDITSVSKNWIILPGSNNLKFTGLDNGKPWVHNFYCNNIFCKEVTQWL